MSENITLFTYKIEYQNNVALHGLTTTDLEIISVLKYFFLETCTVGPLITRYFIATNLDKILGISLSN